MNIKNAKTVGLITAVVVGIGIVAVGTRRRRQKVYLAISVGGTNAKLCLLQKNEHISAFTQIGNVHEIHTGAPADFVQYVKDNFKPDDFDEIAIASFGPLSLKKDQTYGQLIVAPSEQKQPWEKYSLSFVLGTLYHKPSHVETDVNAAAIAEFRIGNHGQINSLAYITIGTGVGVGLVIAGKTVHGFLHPEGGHTW